jgi:PAS domain S-box-containing protein
MRATDWSETALGPVESWPQSLRTCVRIILTSRQPMFVWWGDDLINLYNDAYRSIVGGKHPGCLGQPARIVWREIWDQVSPRAQSAMLSNEGTYDDSLLLIMERYGYREETYYTFSYSPVPNDLGGNGGIICANTDNTQRIIGERQLGLLRDLAFRSADARTAREACHSIALSLATDPKDIGFALLYLEDEARTSYELAESVLIEPGHPSAPRTLPASGDGLWPVAKALVSHEMQFVYSLSDKVGNLPTGAWSEAPHTAAVVPVAPSGSMGRAGALVIGLNPYRLVDENYGGFLRLVAGQISAAIANAEAYEQERLRAESLAELDRAKTIFFSNVSHEFRTPLTLMLGPLEDILSRQRKEMSSADLTQIEIVHRNGLRLLKLVNTLLDFSRLEAGRIQAVYRPVDLSARTIELASVFQSAMERAGLNYIIHCDPLPERVYVDLDMWEKIVLNLLSNAFKFTLHGTVELTLRPAANGVELMVRDTGTGISSDELPRIFERFHRIEGAYGRTHEGTGIGLALVDELVRLHGGTVHAESRLGEGTAFTVTLPFGHAHLPAAQIAEPESRASRSLGAAPYVQEALRWLPGAAAADDTIMKELDYDDPASLLPMHSGGHPSRGRIVLADDNRDMREYVERLLARRYDVVAVADGEQALAAATAETPDLVLTDVMMPRMDGFALLRALRDNARTATIPVIILSARAGEEAETEGLEAGADDYLVKPFTARELMARVGAHISMHRLRKELTAREHELRTKAEEAERQYRAILESISEGFTFVDRDWSIRYINEQAAAISGRSSSEVIGLTLWEAFPGLDDSMLGAAYREAMETGEIKRIEEYLPRSRRWLHANAYPASDGLSIFVHDVTERHMQQEKLLLSEKLAATGRLAATIAHEINNPLESVLNLIYLARTSRAEGDRIREYLLTAEKEVTRVSHIARHTLGFYRETSIAADLDLSVLLEEVLMVYDSRLRASGIELVKDFTIVPPVHALRGELHQVFSNLVSNAIDAMRHGGRLRISTRENPEQAGVLVTVEDNGMGIPPENLSRLFEPFFTTKPSAGTGLGLWVVRQFIDSWGGSIDILSSTSDDNHGTTFFISVPLMAVAEARHQKAPPPPTRVM